MGYKSIIILSMFVSIVFISGCTQQPQYSQVNAAQDSSHENVPPIEELTAIKNPEKMFHNTLKVADYMDSSTIDPSLNESFDIGVFTFFGGPNYVPICADAPVLDALEAYDFLLKPSGTLIYVERRVTNRPKQIQKKDVLIPAGYELKSYEVEVNRPAVEASLKGNNGVGSHGKGKTDHNYLIGSEEGKAAKLYLDAREKEGLKPIITILELVKIS